MSQRHSGREKIPNDLFCTPAWVTEALLNVEEFPRPFWEPASGEGHISKILGQLCTASDLATGTDFLTCGAMPHICCKNMEAWQTRSIITNPPYSNGLAERFVRHALNLTEPVKGKVAMLLPLAFDSAKGRRDLFADHPAFKAKYTLTRRIRWENLEQTSSPSMNHAWFVWDWSDPPAVPECGYLP